MKLIISAMPFDEYEVALVDEIDRRGEDIHCERRLGQPKPDGAVMTFWSVYGRRRGIADAIADRKTHEDALALVAALTGRVIEMEEDADFAIFRASAIAELVDAAIEMLAVHPPFTAIALGSPGSEVRRRQDAANGLAAALKKGGHQ